ncbi:hypothetical protein QTN25_001493 [Entamoeba marina]
MKHLVQPANERDAHGNLQRLFEELQNQCKAIFLTGTLRITINDIYTMNPSHTLLFLLEFCRVFRIELPINTEFIWNEIQSLELPVSIPKTTGLAELLLCWCNGIGKLYSMEFIKDDFSLFLPYYYIFKHYTTVKPLPHISRVDSSSFRQYLITILDPVLKQFNIPLLVFKNSLYIGSNSLPDITTHILSFMFLFIMRDKYYSYAVNVFGSALKTYYYKQNLVSKAQLLSSIFHTINISQCVIQKVHYQQIVETTNYLRNSLVTNCYNSIVKSTINVQSLMKTILNYQQFNKLASSQISVSSIFKRSIYSNLYNEILYSISLSQINSKTLYTTVDYRTCCLLPSFAISKMIFDKYQTNNETNKIFQAISRSIISNTHFVNNQNVSTSTQQIAKLYHHHYYTSLIKGTLTTQAVLRHIQSVFDYETIQLNGILIQGEMRQFLSCSHFKGTFYFSPIVQAVLRSVFQTLEHNTVVTSTKCVQSICKSFLLKEKQQQLKSIIIPFQKAIPYSLTVRTCKQNQAIMKQRINSKAYFDILKASKQESINCQSVAKTHIHLFYERNQLETLQTQTIINQSTNSLFFNSQILATNSTISIMKMVVVPKEEFNSYHEQRKYTREIEATIVHVQSFMRKVIVRYAWDLPEEIILPLLLSYTAEKKPLQSPRHSPCPSPKRGVNIINKKPVSTTIYLSPQRIGATDDRKMLIEHIRHSRKSIIEASFVYIKMVQSEVFGEVTIACQQLLEQLSCSEWFCVMFEKYNCVKHILEVLEVSNKSPPFINLIEMSCRIIEKLVSCKQSAKFFETSPELIPTTVKVGEIMKNYLEIKVLVAAARLGLILARTYPTAAKHLKKIGGRIQVKLKEIQLKENNEIKQAQQIALQKKRSMPPYEKASTYMNKLITFLNANVN